MLGQVAISATWPGASDRFRCWCRRRAQRVVVLPPRQERDFVGKAPAVGRPIGEPRHGHAGRDVALLQQGRVADFVRRQHGPNIVERAVDLSAVFQVLEGMLQRSDHQHAAAKAQANLAGNMFLVGLGQVSERADNGECDGRVVAGFET